MTSCEHVAWTDLRARRFLRKTFEAAVACAQPSLTLARFLPERPTGRCIVIGAGKAAASMAAAVETAWPDVELSGLVVTRDGHTDAQVKRIEVTESAHPIPDARSEDAGRKILALVRGLSPDDLVLALISGGGSSLLSVPAPGLDLSDKQKIVFELLRCGATITEMNLVRRHLSAIKGGRLLSAAAPARVVTLAISDVPGDDPAAIASGPTVIDNTTPKQALEILSRYRIPTTDNIRSLLDRTPAAAPAVATGDFRLIASPMMALSAAAEVARLEGVTPLILGDAIEGESREVGTAMAGIARSVVRHGEPARSPVLLLSGGETTVTIRSAEAGCGGRNTEFLLGFALAIGGTSGVWAVAGDTDGIDGTEDAAGAIVTPGTLARARGHGLDPAELLRSHQSYRVFEQLDDLVVTGPTLTNVNDFRAILVVDKAG